MTTDPIRKQGAIGRIKEVYPNGQDTAVTFDDGVRGAYSTDGLVMLYPKPVILQGLLSNYGQLGADSKTILEVCRLMILKDMAGALELAMKNETVRLYCTTTAENWMELKEQKNKSVKKGKKL